MSGTVLFSSISHLAPCPELENPFNGVVTLTGNSPGDTATYSCNTGFELNGVENRTCLGSGLWENSPPTCERIKGV